MTHTANPNSLGHNGNLGAATQNSGELPQINEKTAYSLKQRSERYRLQNKAHSLVWSMAEVDKETGQKKRVDFTACMRVVGKQHGYAEVQYSDDLHRARFGNVSRCENDNCPICAPVNAEIRRSTLDRAIKAAYLKGYTIAFATYTMRHFLNATLDDSLSVFLRAQRAMRRHRRFKTLREKYGWIESVRVREETWSEKNGWHPHRHEIILLKRELTDEEREEFEYELWRLWFDSLAAQGANCDREHGLDVQIGDKAAQRLADYFTKYGHISDDNPDFSDDNRHGLAAEATLAHKKRAKGKGKTPFELLAAAADGSKRAGRLWKSHFAATKSKHTMTGLKKFCDAVGVDKDSVVAEAEETILGELQSFRTVLAISQQAFTTIAQQKARSKLLELVESVSGDPDACEDYLLDILDGKHSDGSVLFVRFDDFLDAPVGGDGLDYAVAKALSRRENVQGVDPPSMHPPPKVLQKFDSSILDCL